MTEQWAVATYRSPGMAPLRPHAAPPGSHQDTRRPFPPNTVYKIVKKAIDKSIDVLRKAASLFTYDLWIDGRNYHHLIE